MWLQNYKKIASVWRKMLIFVGSKWLLPFVMNTLAIHDIFK